MNILLICVDQHRWDCLGCLGHPAVKTPHLDALAADGLLFTSAYAATAPCAPSRASLFTGDYPDGHGLTAGNGHLVPPDRKLLPQYLRDAGMHTALVGKLHLEPFSRDYGFDHFARSDYFFTNYSPQGAAESSYIAWLRDELGDEETAAIIRRFTADEDCYQSDQWRFIVGTNVVDAAHHPTTWTTDAAIRFLEQDITGRPFFLNVSYFGPHQPYASPAPWDDLFNPADIPLPADFFNPTEDKPIFGSSFYQESLRLRREQGWTEQTHRQALATYYGNIAMIDHDIGRLLAALKARGHWDDTLIIFTADHGDMAGQFGAYFKSLAYEGSAHIPLIIRHPHSSRQGQQEDKPVSLLDLYATCRHLAEGRPPDDTPSRSLLPLCLRADAPHEPITWFKQGAHAACIGQRWKLLRDEWRGTSHYELYDRAALPADAANLFHDPAHQAVASTLKARLDLWVSEQTRDFAASI